MRDYNDIVRRIDVLNRPYIHRRVLGEAKGYPILCLTLSADDALPTILINGGTHGDEPAGVEATLTFLNQDHTRWLKALRFEAIPCLNPYGYVHNTRHNRQGLDINWAFFERGVPEVESLRRLIDSRKFAGIIDLHEDNESPGYYMYEQRRGSPGVGRELVRRVSAVCPVNTNSCIEGDPAVAGLIHPDPDAKTALRGNGIPIVLFQQNTDHYITSETPTEQPIERRIQAHLIALDTMVEYHANPRIGE